jgi:hypothetical protein
MGGGYLDGVDDESGEEEEQAEGQPDEHERDRHGRQPLPFPISDGGGGDAPSPAAGLRRRRRRSREAELQGLDEDTGVALEMDGVSACVCRAALYECISCATSDHPLPFSFASGTACFLLCLFTYAHSRVSGFFFLGKKETGNAAQSEQSISAFRDR